MTPALKALDRAALSQDVAAFLARGGKIQHIEITDSQFNRQPVKRSRQEQVQWLRARTRT